MLCEPRLSNHLPTHLPSYLPTYLPTEPSTYLPTYLPLQISVDIFGRLCVYLLEPFTSPLQEGWGSGMGWVGTGLGERIKVKGWIRVCLEPFTSPLQEGSGMKWDGMGWDGVFQ